MFRTITRLAAVAVPSLFGGVGSSTSKLVGRGIAFSAPFKMASAGDIDWKHAKSIYEFHAKDIDGNPVSLDKYKGLVVLVVNVACK